MSHKPPSRIFSLPQQADSALRETGPFEIGLILRPNGRVDVVTSPGTYVVRTDTKGDRYEYSVPHVPAENLQVAKTCVINEIQPTNHIPANAIKGEKLTIQRVVHTTPVALEVLADSCCVWPNGECICCTKT